MSFPFSKYSGCGNDFILIDNRFLFFDPHKPNRIPFLCDRRLGIGADGIVLLENSTIADYKMRIFNADGSQAEMCGNGIRCLMKFIQELGLHGNAFKIETMFRILSVELDGDHVKVGMGDPIDFEWDLSLENYQIQSLNTGVPHAIIFVEDIEAVQPNKTGPSIRHHPKFPKGTNVNFAKIDEDQVVWVRTYERGVEAETLACGTGATATAIAAVKKYGIKTPVSVKVRSNELLKIDFVLNGEKITDVTMTGPAQKTFSGHSS